MNGLLWLWGHKVEFKVVKVCGRSSSVMVAPESTKWSNLEDKTITFKVLFSQAPPQSSIVSQNSAVIWRKKYSKQNLVEENLESSCQNIA